MKLKVLIVEDEKNIAEAEALILKKEYETRIVIDGSKAVAEAESFRPDVILLDIMLPGKSGFEICNDLRRHPQLRNSKIVIVTAKNQDRDEAQGMNLGADDYIMKPFEPDELRHVVHQVLNG